LCICPSERELLALVASAACGGVSGGKGAVLTQHIAASGAAAVAACLACVGLSLPHIRWTAHFSGWITQAGRGVG
jgi:hypothetical protein